MNLVLPLLVALQATCSRLDPLLGVEPSRKAADARATNQYNDNNNNNYNNDNNTHSPTGLAAYESALKSSQSFACFDGSKSIPVAAVNDDFCDCPDGSDEPGTSACNDSSFYCKNLGHIGKKISSSRVNDGVCDPDCCDGSDEYLGLVKCENRCAKIGAEFKKAELEKSRILQKGIKAKKDLLAHAAQSKESRQKQIKDIESEIRDISHKIEELKSLKADAEKYESHMTALLVQQSREEARTQLPQQLADCSARRRRLRIHADTLNKRVADLNAILEHLAGLKAAEEGAAFEALLRDKPILRETLQRFEEYKASNDAGAGVVELGDPEPEDVVDSNSTSDVVEPSLEQQTQKLLGDDGYERLLDPCVDPTASTLRCLLKSSRTVLLGAVNIVTYPFKWPGWGKLYAAARSPFLTKTEENEVLRKDAREVRSRLEDAEKRKSELESKLDGIKRKSAMDMGPDNVWDKLVGQCIQIASFEYNYEICFLDKATQKPLNGGSGTDLGSFSRWGSRADKNHPSKHNYMMFENGAQCWNGPKRSVEVSMVCGAENKLLSVSEPSKCEYSVKMETPVVCRGEKHEGHEEL